MNQWKYVTFQNGVCFKIFNARKRRISLSGAVMYLANQSEQTTVNVLKLAALEIAA